MCIDPYHGTTSEGMIEWNVILMDEPPRNGEKVSMQTTSVGLMKEQKRDHMGWK